MCYHEHYISTPTHTYTHGWSHRLEAALMNTSSSYCLILLLSLSQQDRGLLLRTRTYTYVQGDSLQQLASQCAQLLALDPSLHS